MPLINSGDQARPSWAFDEVEETLSKEGWLTMANAGMTIESLRVLATQAGLKLTDEELGQIQPGVNRAKAMALALRAMLRDDFEPASVFVAEAEGEGKE